MPTHEIKSTCPCCSTTGSFEILPYGGYHHAGRDMPLVLCKSCRVKFIVHGLSNDEIKDIYREDTYFDSDYSGSNSKSYEQNSSQMMEKADFALAGINRIMNKYLGTKMFPKKSLLDIGCAGGYFLKVARDKYGFEVKGIEVSQSMCEFGRKQLNLNIHCGTISDVPADWGSFAVIYMGDVLEHLPDPGGELTKIQSKIFKNGFLCLELPLSYNLTLSGLIIGCINFVRGKIGRNFFLPAQLRDNYVSKPPYHLNMFDKYSITKLLNAKNFDVIYLKVYEGKPRDKFQANKLYYFIKKISYYITLYFPQSTLGDRLLIVAQKRG